MPGDNKKTLPPLLESGVKITTLQQLVLAVATMV